MLEEKCKQRGSEAKSKGRKDGTIVTHLVNGKNGKKKERKKKVFVDFTISCVSLKRINKMQNHNALSYFKVSTYFFLNFFFFFFLNSFSFNISGNNIY